MSESGEKDEADVQAELEELRQQNAELVDKLREVEEETRARRAALLNWSGWVEVFAVKAIVGRDLAKTTEEWRKAKTLSDPLPAPQTANLAAAVLARVVRVGLVAAAIAVAPTALIVWQNVLVQRQIQQGAIQDYRARRAQLVRTIYDRRECWDDEKPERALGMRWTRGNTPRNKERIGCPAASIQARTAATLSLLQIEGEIRESPSAWPGVVVPKRTNLNDVNLSRAELQEADFWRARMKRANLHHANLSSADLERVDLEEADLHGADVTGTNLHKAFLYRADMREIYGLGSAKLRGADLRHACLDGVSLSRVDLNGVDLSSASLIEANLHGANLSATKMRVADLSGANLSEADLRGVNLNWVKLRGANLSGANLSGANLTFVDLSDVDLSDVDLSGCEYCPHDTPLATRWPPGFLPDSCTALPLERCDGR